MKEGTIGFTGLSAFGHAAFFGIAAYTAALISKYGEAGFMMAAPAGVIAAALSAALFGFIALRVSGVYFLLITLALGQLVFGIMHTTACGE